MHVIRLKTGKEKSLLRRHPWVFAGAVQDMSGLPDSGETVRIVSSKGEFLGWGAYSPASQIRVRVWSWEEANSITPAFIEQKISAAVKLRLEIGIKNSTTAFRLIFGESDELPGFIADQYGDVLVVQFLSSGAEYWRESLIAGLIKISGIANVYERSDADVRQLEGLVPRSGPFAGLPCSSEVIIHENDLRFLVDIQSGHKTGFYLDQRANRRLIRDFASGKDVLDCFSYTGGFAVNAQFGGAQSILAVDSSLEAIELNRKNHSLNELATPKISWLAGDVFRVLREFRDQGRSFDLIILDPPKFAPTIAQVDRAARGYKDINLLALKLLRRGGYLATFSCSGGVSAELFQKIIAGAAIDAKIDARIIKHLHQDCDHPIGINFPEGEYLKGLLINKP